MENTKRIVVILIILSIFAANSFSAFADDNSSYEADIENILSKYHLGHYEEVIVLLNKYYPDQQNEFAYLYGLCYLKLYMNRLALNYFSITLAENENNYEVLNNIGAAYFQEGDYVNAMKYFHLSFIANTGFETAQRNYNSAYQCWISERENESIRPVFPFAERQTMYNSLGWFYYYSGDFQNAVYYFRKAIEEDAEYQFAYISLAYVYIEGNNYAAALRYLLEAEKIDDNNADLYNNLGFVYFHLHNPERAIAAFRKAISLNHRFSEPYNNLGFLFLYIGDFGASEQNFKNSLETNLNNQALRAESTAGLAIVNFKNGSLEQSKVLKEEAIKLDYRMNNIQYLINNLKWGDWLIDYYKDIH